MPELQVGLGVLGVEGDHGLVGLGRPRLVPDGEPGLPQGYEVPDLVPPQRHGLLGELERLGQILAEGEQVGGELVPDLRRPRTVLQAPPEGGLGPREIPVSGVADPQVRVRLPPVGRPLDDLLVGGDGLGVTAEHVEGVGPEGPGAALLHLVRGGLDGLLEELQRLGVVGGVEEGQAGVYEHVGVLRARGSSSARRWPSPARARP